MGEAQVIRDLDNYIDTHGNGTFQEAGDIPMVCHHCRRDLRQCVETGRGPIELRHVMIDATTDALRPVCSACVHEADLKPVGPYSPRPITIIKYVGDQGIGNRHGGHGDGEDNDAHNSIERVSDVGQIKWQEPQRPGEPPLYVVVRGLKNDGMTWGEVAEEMERRYGISYHPQGIGKRVAVCEAAEQGDEGPVAGIEESTEDGWIDDEELTPEEEAKIDEALDDLEDPFSDGGEEPTVSDLVGSGELTLGMTPMPARYARASSIKPYELELHTPQGDLYLGTGSPGVFVEAGALIAQLMAEIPDTHQAGVD